MVDGELNLKRAFVPAFRGAAGAVAGYNAWFGFESDGGYGVVICRSYSPGATQLGTVATNLLRQIAAVAL